MIWDILIITLFVLQLIGLGVVGYLGWKIYKGPVGLTTPRVMQIVRSVHRTGGVIKRNYEGKEARVIALAHKAIATVENTNQAVRIPEMPITYRSLIAGWGSFRMARGIVTEGAKLFKPAPPPGPASAKPTTKSVAHRMGLVPPIVNKLGRAAPFLKTGYSVFRELRRRGMF